MPLLKTTSLFKRRWGEMPNLEGRQKKKFLSVPQSDGDLNLGAGVTTYLIQSCIMPPVGPQAHGKPNGAWGLDFICPFSHSIPLRPRPLSAIDTFPSSPALSLSGTFFIHVHHQVTMTMKGKHARHAAGRRGGEGKGRPPDLDLLASQTLVTEGCRLNTYQAEQSLWRCKNMWIKLNLSEDMPFYVELADVNFI